MKSVHDRFEEKYIPEPNSGCWLWTASIGSHGYGQININKKPVLAHRLSYELFNGEIPHGMWVLHSCDNPACVNPEHLHLGTHVDNMYEMKARGRAGMAGRSEELHPASRVTRATAALIKSDPRSSRAVAAEYGVGHTTVLSIRRGESWS